MAKKPEPQEVEREGLQRIPIPFSAELLAEVDDFRFSARMPSRAEAIRVLLREALDARKARK